MPLTPFVHWVLRRADPPFSSAEGGRVQTHLFVQFFFCSLWRAPFCSLHHLLFFPAAGRFLQVCPPPPLFLPVSALVAPVAHRRTGIRMSVGMWLRMRLGMQLGMQSETGLRRWSEMGLGMRPQMGSAVA